jgi:hypothetical protein
MDRTVVLDNATGAHGTTGYGFADYLVTQFPNRFPYVPTRDFILGTDF